MSNCKVALLGAAFGMLMTDGSFAQQADGKPDDKKSLSHHSPTPF